MLDFNQNDRVNLQQVKDDLAAGRFDSVWTSPGTRNRKRGAINRLQKVATELGGYASLSDVACDRTEIEYLFDAHLREASYPICGLKSKAQADKWLSEICLVCDLVNSERIVIASQRLRQDDWAELIVQLTGGAGSQLSFGNYEMIPITSLVRECRLRGIAIADLTVEMLREIAPSLPLRTMKAIKKAIRQLYALRGTNYINPALLPPVTPDDSVWLAPPVTRVVPRLHENYAALVDDYLGYAAEGRVMQSFGTERREIQTKALSEARIKNIRDALRWLWHGIVSLGFASGSEPFDKTVLLRPTLLYDVVDACANGRLGSVSDTQTRRDRCNDARAFLCWVNPDPSPADFSLLFRSVHLIRTADAETEDRKAKRRSCLKFIRDQDHQRLFFDMPGYFFETARPMIANFEEMYRPVGQGVSKEQNRALELGVMAAVTAINTRFPARLKTLVQLEVAGQNPHVLFPGDEKYADCVLLDIPGRIVKNRRYASGVPLLPGKRVNPREILRWYIDEVHPLVLKYKHKRNDLRRPDLLFTGLNIDTLRNYWRNHTVAAGLDLTPHMCRHYTASLLLASGVSIEDIAELLMISVPMVSSTYAFVNRNLLIQNVMEAQAAIYRDLDV